MGKENNMDNDNYDCHTCGGYISAEHGGIVCRQCEALYCCDLNCINVSPLNANGYSVYYIGNSQSISSCHKCASWPAQDAAQTPQA